MQYLEDSLKKKRILITGGAGFIGSNLAKYFQKEHPKAEVVVFDCFQSGERWVGDGDKLGNLKSLGHFKNLIGFKGEIVAGDITKRRDLRRLGDEWDYIFHLAAVSDTTVRDQLSILRANVNAFKDILAIAKKSGANLVYASSAATYGNSSAPNIVGVGEVPENAYGFSKLAMDNLNEKKAQNYDFSVVGLRYFNVYGNGEFYKGKTASMALQLGLQALKDKKVRLFKNGEQKRDFVYIEDVIQATAKAALCGKSGVFNVGSGKARSFNELLAALKAKLGEFECEYIDNPYEFFQTHTEADISKTCEVLGYKARFSLEDGIKDYAPKIKEIAASLGIK